VRGVVPEYHIYKQPNEIVAIKD
jgi:hypothetical protein